MAGIKGQGTGNQNAAGNRGGPGRPGNGTEWVRSQFLEELLNQEIDVPELVERIKTGKFFLGEAILYQGVVLGKTDVLVKLMDKLFSDRRPLKPLFDQPLTEAEKVELYQSLDRAFEEFPALGYKPRRRLNNATQSIGTPTPVKRSRVRKQRNAV